MQFSALLLAASALISSTLAAPLVAEPEVAMMRRTPSIVQSDASVLADRMLGRDAALWQDLGLHTRFTDDNSILTRDADLAKRIVYNPHITSPTSSSVWKAGESYQVTWDASDMPEGAGPTGRVLLGFIPADGSGGLNLHWTLAQDFPIQDEEVTVTVPSDISPRNDYIVVLMGDSGNASQKFTIKTQPTLAEQINHKVQEQIAQAQQEAGQ